MKALLEAAGYAMDPGSRVWTRPGYSSIAYSDGDTAEERLAALLANVRDVSVLSEELRPLCTDWTSTYHLSSERANLLRPFEKQLSGAQVLEIGAGCGALTRFLGECGAHVLALEGTSRRAGIARIRTRDLEHVHVLAERFDAFAVDSSFDVVTLIGVLEYAALFESGPAPAASMLARVRRLLRPGGLLLLAIENQLGLKYLFGAPEDHLAEAMYGVENRYRQGQPRTYGRATLAAMLAKAGFDAPAIHSPLPDYKLPVTIVAPEGFADPQFNVASLAAESMRRDMQLPRDLAAAPELAWEAVAANDLALDLSNSFLVAARSGVVMEPSPVLAWHYTTTRRAEYCKVSRFVRDTTGRLVVESQPLIDSAVPENAGPLRFHPPRVTPYADGESLALEATRIITRDPWRLADLAAWLRRYLDLLPAAMGWAGESLRLDDAHTLVPGAWFDAIPQNLVRTSQGHVVPIDLEWTFERELPLGYLVFRSLMALAQSVIRFGASDDPRTVDRPGLVVAVAEGAGLRIDSSDLVTYLALERDVQSQVAVLGSIAFTLEGLAAHPLVDASVWATVRSRRSGAVRRSELLQWVRSFALDSAALRRHLSSEAYLERNADVRASGVDPYEHWMAQGYREERMPSEALLPLLEEVLAEREITSTGLGLLEPRLRSLLASRDRHVAEVSAAMGQMSAQFALLTQAIELRVSEQVTGLTRAIEARDARVLVLEQIVAARDQQLADAEAQQARQAQQVTLLEESVREAATDIEHRRHHVAHLESVVGGRDVTIAELQGNLQEARAAATRAEGQVQRLSDELAAVYQSTSWRVTAVLRGTRRTIGGLLPPYRPGGSVFRATRWAYRHAPLPHDLKARTRRFWLRRAFPYEVPALSYRALDAGEPARERMAADACADGHREWEPYHPFVARLAAFQHAERDAVHVHPGALVSVSPDEAHEVARRLRLPEVATPRVSIVIPVYRGAALALECLKSVANARGTVTYEVIVADDASPDGAADILSLVRGVRLQRNTTNLGFLRNCNAAFPLARGEYTVLLNSDVQVTDGWLDGLVKTFEAHQDAGAVGPRILYPSGHLQEAGVAFRADATADMVGLNDCPSRPAYAYSRPVDYCSGAALLVRTAVLADLGGFSEVFAPAYCEDADLCLRLGERGLKTYYAPDATVFHHLSRTMEAVSPEWKTQQIARNLGAFTERWADTIDRLSTVRVLAFYLPQFHAIPENDAWWGPGFTEWTNVRKAVPNFFGHYQPRVPADLGYYDLTDQAIMARQAALARRYGVDGFCYYYYWFAGRRLLDMPVERMLATGQPAFPYCLCWANENWSRRWDGREQEILIGQAHSPDDDVAAIRDIARHFVSPHYIRVDGRPLLLVYRVELFPDFAATAARWRETCRAEGHGEIYLAYVESHDLVHRGLHPSQFGCDASVEFPPLHMGERTTPSGPILNTNFEGGVGDYAELAYRYCTRELPGYLRFRGVTPGWDNTARRQDHSFCFEHASPGVFQAWLETVIAQTRTHRHGDERLVFVNAWNEWAEGAYLEPDERFGHTFLEAVRNARDAEQLLRFGRYGLDL